MTPIGNHVQETARIVLDYLSSPDRDTPNNLVEGIASGKSLLRAIISGDLVVCDPSKRTKPPAQAAPDAAE